MQIIAAILRRRASVGLCIDFPGAASQAARRMKGLSERIDFLVSQRDVLEQWVGAYDGALPAAMAGCGARRFAAAGGLGGRLAGRATQPVLHVVSGNTEHAAFQSVFRAILVGCRSWVKVPSAGLPEFERWAAGVAGLDVRRELPGEWRAPEVAVVYGGADTLDFFRSWLSPETRIIPHGPKLSAAFVFAEREGLAKDLAEDVMRYGQRGCLSVQMIYVKGDVESFCVKLAGALDEAGRPKITPTLSEAGAVRNERELARFRIANGAEVKMWESEGSVNWTVVWDSENQDLRTGRGAGLSGWRRCRRKFTRLHSAPKSAFSPPQWSNPCPMRNGSRGSPPQGFAQRGRPGAGHFLAPGWRDAAGRACALARSGLMLRPCPKTPSKPPV